MRRGILSVVLGLLFTAAFAPGALAAPPNRACGVGPDGAGNSTIGEWQLWDEATLAAGLADHFGLPAQVAADVFDAEDKNNDGLLCVLVQVLPNDASGSDTWFVSHDNNAKKKS